MNAITPISSNGMMGGFSMPSFGGTPALSRKQKAAIITHLILTEGAQIPLANMSDDTQTALTEEIAMMRSIDRDTMISVVEEFIEKLEHVGLSFPGGLDGALSILDGHLSATAASRLRRKASGNTRVDPWERISGLPVEQLLPVLAEESTEIGAVMLSKLSVPKAADLLGKLPGDKARRVAYAVSLTGNVAPDTVRRIGMALLAQLDSAPPKAFDTGPVERVGAILNYAAANTRDSVLEGLDEQDADFADQVRKAIFTFTNIATRIDARDIPKILRNVDQAKLVVALAGAKGAAEKSVEFILSNISQRMAGSIRDEMKNLGKVKDKDAEEAQSAVVTAIREMESAGEIFLVAGEVE
ncbi:flagellar motor switch protein FliG [Phaeovulum sp. W22_SRMD_FR3]|uniref:flagellar motor switch protein FliG n=1 Tax=Phaeovulum sp. W22_SRMD_FR3 TaxID=3240274 RepID=UPI003F9D2EBA